MTTEHLCWIKDCNNKRCYTIGNEKYFCKTHQYLGSRYTKLQLESGEKLESNEKRNDTINEHNN